jgi:HEAT repeat protein
MTDTTKLLDELFSHEETVRKLHAELAEREDLLAAVAPAVSQALGEPASQSRSARLVRGALLLGEVPDAKAVDLLIDILGCEEPEVRQAAGIELEELAYDHWKLVTASVERAIGRLPTGHRALSELPYILSEVAEDGATKILAKFLVSKDAEVVASTIEAMATQGDPAAVRHLEALQKDKRTVTLEDEDGNEGTVSLGELARDAIEMLKNVGH